jgi:DNA-binding response OmpR family regulator
MTQRILVVDDEREIRRLVASYLIDDDFHVEELDNGPAVIERLQRQPAIDLIVLDVRMPGPDGIDTLRDLRRFSDVHVIMLTAAAEETDRLIGLSVGADDYITKPFSPREVVARVKAVLRRTRTSTTQPPAEPLRFDGITVDIDRYIVTVDDQPVDLSALQFNLLRALAESPGRVFARHQLIDRVWGRDFYGEERIVDVHVGNLRKALGDSATEPRFIETIRSVGYRFIA